MRMVLKNKGMRMKNMINSWIRMRMRMKKQVKEWIISKKKSQGMNDNENEEHRQLVNKEGNAIIIEDDQATIEDFVFPFNVDDLGNWDMIKRNIREFLVERSPKWDNDITFHIDHLGRHFNSSHYTRVLQNGRSKIGGG